MRESKQLQQENQPRNLHDDTATFLGSMVLVSGLSLVLAFTFTLLGVVEQGKAILLGQLLDQRVTHELVVGETIGSDKTFTLLTVFALGSDFGLSLEDGFALNFGI